MIRRSTTRCSTMRSLVLTFPLALLLALALAQPMPLWGSAAPGPQEGAAEAADPLNPRVYVTNQDNATVSVVDAVTL